MRRRDFIKVIAGSATGWPFTARAQKQIPRIGVLIAANSEPFWNEFREAMRGRGYIAGKNIQFELRSTDGKPDLLQLLAGELVRLNVDVIVATQTPAVTAAKQATFEIPVVMAPAGDPVGTGLITSLARPGGNVTGLSATTTEMGGKLLELMREMLPSARRVAVFANASDPFTKSYVEQFDRRGRTLGVAIKIVMVSGVEKLEAAFRALVKERVDAIIVQPSLPRKLAIDLALKHRLPAFSSTSLFTGEGGLMSYEPNLPDLYQRAAGYVDRILKGAKPADLPVEQPTKFVLGVNLKTAKVLGITVPPKMLADADEIIE